MVLCEGYSIIIRTSEIKDKYFGGYEAFQSEIPNSMYCSDDELESISFLTLADAIRYSLFIEDKGMTLHDYCYFHMLKGPYLSSPWINFYRFQWFDHSENFCTFAWLRPKYGGKMNLEIEGNEKEQIVAVPGNWRIDTALDAKDEIKDKADTKRFQILKDKNGLLVMWDKLLERVVYSARTFS